MVVAEMRAADVPVEVLGLDVEGERVGDQRIERGRYLTHRLGRQIGRGIEPRGRGARLELFHLGGHGGTSCLGKSKGSRLGLQSNARVSLPVPLSAPFREVTFCASYK